MVKIYVFSIILIFFYGNCFITYSQIEDRMFNTKNLSNLSKNEYIIDKILISGNKKTKENIILRELSNKIGSSIKKNELLSTIEADKRRLINTNLFNDVSIKIEVSDNKIILIIDVIESFYLIPSFIFELSDRNFNDWWTNFDHDISRINYGGGLFQYNLSGRADILEINFRRGFIREFLTSYYLPYLSIKQKGGLELKFNYLDYDHLAYNTLNYVPVFHKSNSSLKTQFSTSVEYSHRESFYNYHFISIEHNSILLNDTLLLLNDKFYDRNNKINLLTVGYEFNRDFRDFKNYPLEGFRLNFRIKKDGIGVFNDINKWSIKVYYSNYYKLKNNYFYSFNLSTLNSSRKQPFLMFESNEMIRGFEKYLIHGYSNIIFKNSFKKEILSFNYERSDESFIKKIKNIPIKIYIKTFFDSGIIWGYKNLNYNNYLNNTLLNTYGIGIDFVTIKNISLTSEFSRNSSNEFNLSFKLGADF